MSSNYFRDLEKQTPTRVWVNNPTAAEIELALAHGAVGCTTNPAHVGGLVRRAPAEVREVITAVTSVEPDDERAAEEIQVRMVRRILPHFAPIFDRSGGRAGFVSVQGAPERDHDAGVIEAQARGARALGANCIPKIPATEPGLQAFEALVRDGEPTLVTEVFSLAQVIATCERYLRTCSATGVRPPLILAPITGIFGDRLRVIAQQESIEVDPAELGLAGILFARAAARLVREREYPVTLLFGGARAPVDLTGLVGSRHQATINWSTFAEILEADPPVRTSIDDEIPESVRRSLTSSFDEMRRALEPEGLALEEFEAFGPVQHFRGNFITGWRTLLGAISEARSVHLGAAV